MVHEVGVAVLNPVLYILMWYNIQLLHVLQVKYKHMTPAAALQYVRSRRPRVLLAPSQWKVNICCHMLSYLYFSILCICSPNDVINPPCIKGYKYSCTFQKSCYILFQLTMSCAYLLENASLEKYTSMCCNSSSSYISLDDCLLLLFLILDHSYTL